MNWFLLIKEKFKTQREMSLEEDIEFKNAIRSRIKILEDSPLAIKKVI